MIQKVVVKTGDDNTQTGVREKRIKRTGGDDEDMEVDGDEGGGDSGDEKW